MIKLFILATIVAANLAFSQVSSIPSAAGGGASTFDNVGSGTNTSATLTCGAGCTLVTTAGVFRLPNGTTAPATCTVGDAFFDTDATAGSNFYGCTATNTWTLMSGGGSGASYPSDLRCDVERTDSNTLTVFAGASASQPCIVGKTSFTSPATLDTTGTAATGTYRFEVRDGVIYARLPGATTGLTAGGLTMEASSASFSANAVEIRMWDQAVAGTWDAGTGTDRRAFLTTQIVPVAGTLMSSSDSGGNRTLNVDTTNIYATNYLRSTSGNDTYVAGTTPATTDYVRGRCYALDADTANTGAATVNIDSLGAKSILRRNGDALSDGDITANKPITVCYDGTQFIIQGDGGGSTTLSGNYWYWPMWDNFPSAYVALGTTPRAYSFVAPFSAPVTKIGFVINGAATLPGANADGINIGINASGCATQIVTGSPYTGSGSGGQSVTLSSTWNMTKDTVYCLVIGTDSATVQLATPDQNATITQGLFNQGTVRMGTCSNANTGDGTTLAVPTDCGTITSAIVPFHLILLP